MNQRQHTGDSRKPEGHRCCLLSRPRGFLLVLLMATVLFVYNRIVMELAKDLNSKWWPQHNETHWWLSFNHSETLTAVKEYVRNKSTSVKMPKHITQTVAMPRGGREASTATALQANKTIPIVKKPETTPKAGMPPPIPYVSPGPYSVEYPYDYHFVINEPEKCQQLRPFVVLMVPVAPQNREHRDFIRSTWGSERLVLGKAVGLFFLLGRPTVERPEEVQRRVLQESGEHRDLLQSDFLDCYKNLTIKTMVMLEWQQSYCSSASYVMKVDSDTFLNVRKLVEVLSTAPKENYLTGHVAHGATVLRNPRSKWYLPASAYPEPTYPLYALGLGYVMSSDLPKKLVEASRQVKTVYIEDVYIGMCMKHLRMRPANPPAWRLFNLYPLKYSRCAYSKIIVTLIPPNTNPIFWTDFIRPGPYC